jgi:S-adenosylmethionine:tRNA ribosyltransferase-isomerase
VIATELVGPAAHRPPEARGLARDGVRLLVGRRDTGEVSHHAFTELPRLLRPGDVLAVNTSATLPAAVPVAGGSGMVVHFSTELSPGVWLVELRERGGKAQHGGGTPGTRYRLAGGAEITLREAYSEGRLWVAEVDADLPAFLYRHGRPIRYDYVDRPWPLPHYQTVFATEPGSAEMPSAARPFTDRLVTQLVAAGVLLVPLLLHTGVASPEAHERPYPERFVVPATTARVVNQARADGGRVIAVGTTAVRALESAATAAQPVGAATSQRSSEDGTVRAARGWTDLVVSKERGVRVVDGLLTGLHEPRASHLMMLAAIAGPALLERCYAEAVDAGYLWHEFGDSNLLLPD